MCNKTKYLLKTLSNQKQNLKYIYEEFRIYNVGSYALNRLTSKKGYVLHENIVYGLAARHRLDLYIATLARENRPLMIFVHGGAWSHGDKKDYRFVGEAFAKEGFDVAVINYNLAPQHIFPVYIDDLSIALNYLDLHQSKLNVSTQNIVMMGHSAGAFNVMSAIYNPQAYDIRCKANIKALVGLAGPYHFDYKGDPLCADAFNQEEPYQNVMPYYFVESNDIRHYLLIAENDKIVHLNNALDFDEKLKEIGNHSEMVIIPKTGHITLMGSVSSIFSRFYSTKKEIMKVLNQALS